MITEQDINTIKAAILENVPPQEHSKLQLPFSTSECMLLGNLNVSPLPLNKLLDRYLLSVNPPPK